MTLELILVISALCSSPNTSTSGTAVRQQQKECVAKYLNCVRTKKNVAQDEALERCVVVDKLDL